jgi:hypothetical protein
MRRASAGVASNQLGSGLWVHGPVMAESQRTGGFVPMRAVARAASFPDLFSTPCQAVGAVHAWGRRHS